MTQQPPPGQGSPAYGGYRPLPPNHPQATTVLVLGILGILVCGLIGPFAWSMGNRVVAEIQASGGAWGGQTEATIGRVLGIVTTLLLVASLAFVVALFAFGGTLFSGLGFAG